MIHAGKDPSFRTLLLQEALASRGLYAGELDNWPGPATEGALAAAQEAIRAGLPEAAGRGVSDEGIELIKHFEGLYLTAYQDEVGVWTIGYGHTGLVHQDGTVHEGRVITAEQAEELLRRDLEGFGEKVAGLVRVPLDEGQFAALVSFAFNVGDGNLKGSTLLRKLNAGDYAGAAGEFTRWNKAGGKVLRGLTRRRQSEANLFEGKRPFLVT